MPLEHPSPRLQAQEPAAELRARMRLFYRDATREETAVVHDEHYFRKYLDAVLRFVPVGIDTVLELGAGNGEALGRFVRERSPARVLGLELSLARLRAISGRGAPFVGIAGDALELPIADRSVDLLTCFQVIEHLPSVGRTLDEMFRVVRRPGYIAIGIPNHASLLTPLQDLLSGRTRLAFGVAGRADAARWLLRNAGIAAAKRLSSGPRYLYREPVLGGSASGGDSDAVYYACPVDLYRDLSARGATLLGTDAMTLWGPVGRFVPSELRGSTVAIWRLD